MRWPRAFKVAIKHCRDPPHITRSQASKVTRKNQKRKLANPSTIRMVLPSGISRFCGLVLDKVQLPCNGRHRSMATAEAGEQ
jgi:hypothetical protein